jgi:hypothetical protein
MLQVVNAYGNLNGTHPDPLDEDLHALVTADSMVSADWIIPPLMITIWEPGCSVCLQPTNLASFHEGT